MVYVAAEKVMVCVIEFFLFCSCASLSVDVVLREKNAIFNGKINHTKHPYFKTKEQRFSFFSSEMYLLRSAWTLYGLGVLVVRLTGSGWSSCWMVI